MKHIKHIKYMDRLIKDLVIEINNNNIHTVMSCQGHNDWGCKNPWLAIKTNNLKLCRSILRKCFARKNIYIDVSNPTYTFLNIKNKHCIKLCLEEIKYHGRD